MANRNGLPGIEAEFERAELGDARLNKRLMSFASAFANAPDESLPEMAGSIAEREAHYRLLNNERVEFELLLAAHIQQSRNRVAEAKRVLIVHDTTSFVLE